MGRVRLQAQTTTAPTPVNALTEYGDARDFNAGFNWETASGLPTQVWDLIGTNVRDNPVRPQGDNVLGTVRWQLDSGATLNVKDGVITFSFLDPAHVPGIYNNKKYGFTEQFGYTAFSEAQKAAGRIAIHNWDDLIAPSFKEVNGNGGSDILMANTTTGPAQAWAYYPIGNGGKGSQFKHLGSDAWIHTPTGPDGNPSNGQLAPGFYGLATLVHELGHTLGLSHPGNYDFGDDTDGDGVPDPITYTGDAQYFQDSRQFTIMSYFDAYETGAQNIDWNLMRFVYSSTPMVDDVFVIQQKYGADMTTRTGDTTYGFNATSDVWNEAMRFHDGEMATVFTIWDAGGNDTLDLSGYYTPSVIDLREGAFSSAGGLGAYDPDLVGLDPLSMTQEQYLAIVNANNDDAGLAHRSSAAYDAYFTPAPELGDDGIPLYEISGSAGKWLMEQNIAIAYGAIIENAIGGEGNDRINGNQADNLFTGNGGADTFIIADYSGEVASTADPTDWSKTLLDTSVDTITDFHTGEDKIDLTSFGTGTVSGLSYDGTDLHFSANGHSYTVHLLGAAIDLGSDVLVG